MNVTEEKKGRFKTKIEIDTTDVDICLDKLERLKSLLIEVNELMISLTHTENTCDKA